MDYLQFTNEVQRLGRLATREEAEAVTYSVLRAVSEVLPMADARDICACLPAELSGFLEPRCTEPDPEFDINTFLGWTMGSIDAVMLPDRSIGGMDLMASYAPDEATRRCQWVFGALKSCLESGQCDVLSECLPDDVKGWFAEA